MYNVHTLRASRIASQSASRREASLSNPLSRTYQFTLPEHSSRPHKRISTCLKLWRFAKLPEARHNHNQEINMVKRVVQLDSLLLRATMFFISSPPFPLFDAETEAGREGIRDYAAHLARYTPLARSTPLVPGYTFAFHSSLPGGQKSSVARRPLPRALRQPGTWSLTLERPLKEYSSDMSSGVWLAQVDPDQGISLHQPFVVVKFIQSSLLPYPGNDYNGLEEERPEFHSEWTLNYESPDHIARLEAASYDHLESLQGDVIPYFFGKDIVRPLWFSEVRWAPLIASC